MLWSASLSSAKVKGNMPDSLNRSGDAARALAKEVSIIGCGWLGFPLAQRLIQEEFTVRGSTTHLSKLKSLRDAGIQASLLRLETSPETSPDSNPDSSADHLESFDSNVESEGLKTLFSSPQFVLNIPPSQAFSAPEHIGQIDSLLRRVANGSLRHFVYVSSTSVYGANSGSVDEETEPQPQTLTGEILLEAERFLKEKARAQDFALTIVRAGGLIGFGRHPGRFLAGKTGLKNADEPVNMIHQLDLVECLVQLLSAPVRAPGSTELFNAVAASHPSREEFYTKAALRLDLPPPQFIQEDRSSTDSTERSTVALQNRRISGAKLKAATGVRFQFDDLMEALESRRL